MKEKMKIDSLKKKTVVFIFIITVFCTLVPAFIASHILENQMTDNYEADKEVTIGFLSYSLAPMLDLYNYKQVEQIITLSLTHENIASIAVFDERKSLIRSATKQNVSTEDLDMEKCEITTSMKGIIGSTEIGFSKEYINKRIRTMKGALIFALMGFFILVGLGLYEFMSRSVIEPLETFTETVKGMNSENLSARVKIRRNDEIGMLAASFNQMAGNLEKSHRALRKSEDRFRTIFNAVNDAIFVHDLETGAILDVNSRMCEMYGYSREEVRQLNIEALSMGEPPYTQQDALSWIKKAAGGQPQIFEWRARRKPGDFFWADMSMRRAEIGGQDRLLVVVRDITQRKLAEKNLRETNEFLKNILNSSSSISIVSTDLEGNVLFWNKGSENIFGYKAKEIEGRQKIDILYRDDETKKVVKKIRPLIFENEREASIDIKEVTKDGRELWMNLSLTPRFDEENNVIGVLGIGKDISERKQAEEALEKAYDELEVKVEERTKKLKEEAEKLVRMNKLFVDRELRMKVLKEEIKKLKRRM